MAEDSCFKDKNVSYFIKSEEIILGLAQVKF